MSDYPRLLHTVLDAENIRELAEFYRRLLGLQYREGDEPPFDGPDDADWLVLTAPDGTRCLAFQQTAQLTPTSWPAPEVPMQLHLDFTVADRDALELQRAHAETLGARLLLDRADAAGEEPLYVLADPAGHPFCLFVG